MLPQTPPAQAQPAQPLPPGSQRLITWHHAALQTDAPPHTLPELLRDPAALVWLDILGDGASQEILLKEVFELDPITIQNMREPKERARFIELERYFYLVMHGMAFDAQTNEALTPKLDIVFGQNFMLTVHPEPLVWLDTLVDEVQAPGSGAHLMDRGVAVLLYALLDSLVESYFPVLDDLDGLIDELEDITATTASNDVQLRIFRIKRALAELRRVISPQVEVANSLVFRAGKFIPVEAQPYFAEVHDHLIRAFEVLDSYRDLMSGILDVYLTTVSNRLNVIMKQTAIIATIFLPITFITGVFGQNFGHLPQVENDSVGLFWWVLAVMALITVVQIWIFRKRGWF